VSPLLFLIFLFAAPSGQAAQTPPAAPAKASASYRIPFRLSDTKHLVIRAKINGHGPFNFIMDTGAPAIYLSKEAAKKAGVKPDELGWGLFDRMEIEGGAILEKVQSRIEEPMQLTGMNQIGLGGVHLDGVFGYSLLARFRIQLDLTQPAMTWTPLNIAPPRLLSLNELSGGEAITPSADFKAMEQLAKMASSLLKRDPPTIVTRGFLGIELADEQETVRVHAVLPQSPAAAAGLMAGDQITKAGMESGELQTIRLSRDVRQLFATVAPGEVVRIGVLRAKKPMTLSVHAGKGGL
jgi:hypothetical protein